MLDASRFDRLIRLTADGADKPAVLFLKWHRSLAVPFSHSSWHRPCVTSFTHPFIVHPHYLRTTMPHSRPFPAVTGGCFCGAVRYRLLTAPLFCHACHCSDCHKHTGSVFACYTSIEAEYLSSIGSTAAQVTTSVSSSGLERRSVSCPKCGTKLWTSSDENPVTVDVRTGTLDHPELMEPDLHAFIESRIPWIHLPEGAKTCNGYFDFRKMWPASSLKRFDAAILRHEEKLKQKSTKNEGVAATEDEKEADKTPTAQSPEQKEDDEEFEKRYRETEKALQERLEKLTIKLDEEDKV
jgi:hypothetical protein